MKNQAVKKDTLPFSNDNLSKIFLRIAIAFLAMHGIVKMAGDLSWYKDSLVNIGLPSFLWIGIPFCQIIAPLCILLGIFTIILGHPNDVFSINQESGGFVLELNYVFMLVALSLFFSGSGKYSIYQFKNKWLN